MTSLDSPMNSKDNEQAKVQSGHINNLGTGQGPGERAKTVKSTPPATGNNAQTANKCLPKDFTHDIGFITATTRNLQVDLNTPSYPLKIQRISLTGFPAQSVGSSNIEELDSPCLLVLITGTSQSRQHGNKATQRQGNCLISYHKCIGTIIRTNITDGETIAEVGIDMIVTSLEQGIGIATVSEVRAGALWQIT
nr:hypothetical protein [Tanacetum cinerariifolium]